VELASFNSYWKNGSLLLKWETTTELNSYLFEIQASNDQVVWEVVTTQTASGFSSTPKIYSAVVLDPQTFYRIKMLDRDGSFTYSNTINVDTPTSGLMEYYNQALQISLRQDADAQVFVYSSAGKLIKQTNSQGRYFVVPMQDIPSGIYIAQLVRASLPAVYLRFAR
jgi:hypothetical protein